MTGSFDWLCPYYDTSMTVTQEASLVMQLFNVKVQYNMIHTSAEKTPQTPKEKDWYYKLRIDRVSLFYIMYDVHYVHLYCSITKLV